jgi:hypothetical protein
MNLLSTPFDGQTLPAAVPGQWSASTSVPSLPSLPEISAASGDPSSLATPWDASPFPPTRFAGVSELPTL